jgi:hypothetical protein
VADTPKLSKIHLQILEVLKAHPEGLTEGEMRALLNLPSEQHVQFGRRRRDLHYHFKIDKVGRGVHTKYVYAGPLEKPRDSAAVSPRIRAEVLHDAHGRCQMCGKTIAEHGVALVVDHKVPREWGGPNTSDNLWAICTECNAGKKNFFASVDSPEVRHAMREKSPHMRIGELLKAAGKGKPLPARLIQFVADQDQWDKRLRELRYLGWKIKAKTKKNAAGRTESFYILEEFKEWIPDVSKWIQQYERDRENRNRASKKSRKR